MNRWKGVIGDFKHAIILLVFERCKVLVMFSGMICDGVCKMELYCERCYFVFEKRYRCRGRVQPLAALRQNSPRWKQRREGVVSSGKFLGIDYWCPIGN